MLYKCEAKDGSDGCANCSKKTYGGFACNDYVEIECPLSMGLSYPERKELCDKCCFVPEKEVKDMIMTEEEMDEQLELMEELDKKDYHDDKSDEEWEKNKTRLEEIKELLSEREEQKERYETFSKFVRKFFNDDLITVRLHREQIKNIVEFIDMNLIPFIQDEDNEVDNIMYLHSMTTAYATLMEALGENP
jgi:hypothetical protein